jgi:hypothetical protein
MAKPGYEIKEDKSEKGVKYFFISKGKNDIVKAIQYSYITDMSGKNVFNLGFGDYDINLDSIDDSINTDNGDVYRVFNTVLSTIPQFFAAFQNAVLMVQGSDSDNDYIKKCKLTCKKKCTDYCKNQHRRISIYSYYLNKNFETLIEEYTFFGGVRDDTEYIRIEEFIPQKKYDSVFVMKKNL